MKLNTEPVAVIGGLTQLVTAVIGLLLIFEVVDWTQEQTGAVMAVWAAITGLVLVLWVRAKVTPTDG